MGKRVDYQNMLDKVYGKPTTRDTRDMLVALHWLLDGNVAALSKHDPYLWYLRGGVERLIARADKERKKNL